MPLGKGDHYLSHLPFYIFKEVLIRGRRGSLFPSHVMYAYNSMIFCEGTLANMNIFKNLFDIYAQAS